MLLSDETFADSDVYVAGYETPPHGGTMTLDEVVSALKNRFDADAVFSEHQEIIFVAHSLGGLVVQRLLLTYPTLVPSTKLIYFFSTPESGSGIARYARIFNSDPLIGELRSGPRNDYLESLEDSWRAAPGVGSLMTRCAYETKKTHHVLVVDRLSATRMCPIGTPLPIPKDHISIVKPCSVKDDAYIALNNAVREIPKGDNSSAAAGAPGSATAPGRTEEPIRLSATIGDLTNLWLQVENHSDRIAKGVIYEVVLFRESDLAFFSFTTTDIGYLKAFSKGPSEILGLETAKRLPTNDPPIKKGDVFTGQIIIDCADCVGARYILHLVWGESGWFCEQRIPLSANGSGKVDMTPEGRKRIIAAFTQVAPAPDRIPIR
jgi:hypothetical protein